jgi:hypothetical protein
MLETAEINTPLKKKICKKCGLPFDKRCKPCGVKYTVKWNKENVEKRRLIAEKHYLKNIERKKKYTAENRIKNYDRIKEKQAEYRKENSAKIRASNLQYKAKNAEKIKEYNAQFRIENLEKMRERSRKNRLKNPERGRIDAHNRRSRKRNNGGKLSNGLAEKLYKLQKGKCACCGKRLGDDYHLDHILPLALGGENIDSNMQLLSSMCNQQKHAKHPIEFMQSRGFLL